MSLQGNLDSFSLAEILQTLGLNARTGMLEVAPPGKKPRYIRFSQGRITAIMPYAEHTFPLGEILLAQGTLTAEDLSEALQRQAVTGKPLGAILVEEALATERDVQRALETQIREELHDLLLLTEGRFEFVAAEQQTQAQEELPGPSVSVDPQALCMEAARYLDEWEAVRQKVPSFGAVPTKSDARSVNLPEEEGQAYRLVDGRTTVRGIARALCWSILRCAHSLAGLAEAGLIRFLTVPELIQLAKTVPPPQRVPYLRCAVQLQPANPNLRILLADAFLRSSQSDEAIQILAQGLHATEEGNLQDKEPLVKALLKIDPQDPHALRALVALRKQEGKTTEALRAAAALAEALLSTDTKAAKEALASVSDIVPEDKELCMKVAQLWRSLGHDAEAIPYLEAAALWYEKARQFSEAAKIFSWILEGDSTRSDIKFRLTQVRERLALARKKRKIRLFVAAGVAVVLLAAGVFLFLQFHAKKAFAGVRARSAELLKKHRYKEAETLLRRYVVSYPWSPALGQARKELARIVELREKFKAQREHELQEEKQRLDFLRQKARVLLLQAQQEEKQGNLKAAFETLNLLRRQFPGSPQAKAIRFPLRVTSTPTGALVQDQQSGKILGHTPVVAHYGPEEKPAFVLRYPGCAETTWKLAGKLTCQVHVKLPWAALNQFRHRCPVYRRLVPWKNCVLLSAPDGSLMLLDPREKTIRWRRKIGQYGDPASGFLLDGSCVFVGNIDGDLWCLNADRGQKVWHLRLQGSTHFRPLRLSGGRIAAVSRRGYVSQIENGRSVRRILLEGAPATDPGFGEGLIVVGTKADLVYALASENLSVVWQRGVDGDVTAGPVSLRGTTAVATKNKSLFLFETKTGKLLKKLALPAQVSADLVAGTSSLFVPLRNGVLLQLAVPSCTVGAHQVAAGALGVPLVLDHRVVVGGADGTFCVLDSRRKAVTWQYGAPAPIRAQPCSFKDKILFSTIRGDFFLMKLLD